MHAKAPILFCYPYEIHSESMRDSRPAPTLASAQLESPPAAGDLTFRVARGVLLIGPVLKGRPAWLRYSLPLALVLAVGLTRFGLLPLLGPQAPLLPFVLAIYGAAYLGGFGPALLASAFSAMLATALFTSWPTGPHAGEWIGHVAFFLGVGVLVSLIMHQLQRAYGAEHQALLALRQSEERLRLITDHLPALIAYIDHEEVYQFTNGAYTQWFEGAGSIVGRSMRQVLGETVYQDRRSYIEAVLRGELVSFVAPKNHRTLGVRECELTYVPDGDSSTGVRGFYAMVRDVTERLQAERALQDRERMLKLIYDNSSDSLFLAQLEPEDQFRFVSVNEPFLRAWGLERQAVQGHLMEASVPATNQALLRAHFHEALTTRRAVVYEDVAELPAGRRHGEVTLTPIIGDNDTVTHILGCVADVTARKQAEEALRAADRRKDEFLSMLAHELRNPLAPIRNVAQILASGRVDADEVRRTGELLTRQTTQLAHLLDDLLEVARITHGVIQLKKKDILLEDVVDRAIETVQPLLSVKRQTVNHGHAHRPLVVNADAARLSQIFENLLSNAAKYSPDRSIIHVSCSCTAELASVHVRDEGSGIDPQILPHIFDLFMQADRSLDRAQGGLGVGLTIVKQLVGMHGGTVEAHSEGLGRGSEFIVRLPLQVTSSAPPPASTQDPPSALGRRVLIVEDNVDSAESLAMLLSADGHEARITHDGAGALQALETFAAEWVLLDIGLPGMDGYLVAQTIRERYPERPLRLYAVSGYGRQEDRALALASGFDGHLTKPVDPAHLLALIAERDSSEPAPGVNTP
jgi:PAS domain S-box-containing protein